MADAAVHGHGHEDHRGFFTRWFCSTNHKDIGILYIVTAFLVGVISIGLQQSKYAPVIPSTSDELAT